MFFNYNFNLLLWLFYGYLYLFFKNIELITLTLSKKGFTNGNFDYKIVTSIIKWYKKFQFWKMRFKGDII